MMAVTFTARRLLAGALILLVLWTLVDVGQGQHFYPNGRYGRRSAMPALTDIPGGREMTVAFFGDGSVQCVYTGFEDYYRCKRKEESRSVSPVVD